MEFSPRKRSERINNSYCSVPGCKSKGDKNLNVKFHLFPSVNKKVKLENKFGVLEEVNLLKAWQAKTKIGKRISRSMRICSLHFTKEDYKGLDRPGLKKRYLKETAIPSLNLPSSIPARLDVAEQEPTTSRASRLLTRNILKSSLEETSPTCISFETTDNMDLGESHDATVNNDELIAAEALCELLQAGPLHQKSFREVSVQVNTGHLNTVCDLIDSDSKLNSFTGLPNMNLLEKLVILVRRYDDKKIYRLGIKEKIILCLAKLKTNSTYVVLGLLFGATSQTCKNVVFNMVKCLAMILKPCIKFPDSIEIKKNLPLCFKGFESTRIILDCTEILIQKPKCLCCRIKCYSQYKSNMTLKFMIGVTPGGLITFVSKCYGGRTSDKVIFEQSNLIKLLDRGTDSVMVDKGFLIDTICYDHDIKLIRPPFLRSKPQLSKEEAKLNAAIAAARVHIERANQRIKLFSILSGKLQWPLVSISEDILAIACAIANLSSPIIADDKFMNI